MAHPVVLSKLIKQFETLLRAEQDTPETRRRLEDVTYTLCVSTGTRTAEAALTAARAQLAAAEARISEGMAESTRPAA